jgi:hypothetical protein
MGLAVAYTSLPEFRSLAVRWFDVDVPEVIDLSATSERGSGQASQGRSPTRQRARSSAGARGSSSIAPWRYPLIILR